MKRDKQTDVVLSWLRRWGELTTLEAVLELGIMSLPKRIEELRKEGYAIETHYRKSAQGKRYGVYKLMEGSK